MPLYVDKFELDNQEILIKDSEARELLETSPKLYGKKVILLGDSLSGGFADYGTLNKTWLDVLTTKYNLDSYNYSLSGSKISNGNTPNANDYCNRIDDILLEHDTCDIFIVQGGANDKNDNIQIGSINNANNNTYIGAIKNIIAKVRNKYGKNCQLLFMTTYHRFDTYNTRGHNEYDYVEAMQRACSLFSIPCFNNYNECGISLAMNSYTDTPYRWADSGLDAGNTATNHFSVKAYEFLAEVYEGFLENCYINSPINKYYQVVENGIVWTKQKLPNGSNLITFEFNATYDYDAFVNGIYYSVTKTITPPASMMNDLSYILDIEMSVSGPSFNDVLLNNDQSWNRIGYVPIAYSANAVGSRTCHYYGHIITLDT